LNGNGGDAEGEGDTTMLQANDREPPRYGVLGMMGVGYISTQSIEADVENHIVVEVHNESGRKTGDRPTVGGIRRTR
jgi:hypothetical protein